MDELEMKMNKIVELMPTLQRYSIVLLTYLVVKDPEGIGISLKQWYIMEVTGLCQRSLQLAIKQLEDCGLLERRGGQAPDFIVLL